MAETSIFVWTKYDNQEPHRTGHTAETIEEYDWRNPWYFEQFMYFFADADGNAVDVEVAEVPEDIQLQITSHVQWLYGTSWGTVGGPFHIVTDDHNLEDDHVLHCINDIDAARWDNKDLTASDSRRLHELGTLLMGLSLGQRHLALEAAEREAGPY